MRWRASIGAMAVLVAEPAGARDASWAMTTESPVAVDPSPLDPLEREALARCGEADAGLVEAARAIAARKVRRMPMPDVGAIAFAQRAAGEPHPWARAWAANVAASAGGGEDALRKLEEWLARDRDAPLRRCGAWSAVGVGGARVLAVVVVDALADLAAMPIRVRSGQWVAVEARLRVRARGGTVFVLGPGGFPRTLLTSFDGATLRARFAPDRPGEFTVQVVADIAGGPRPVLEASVFADVDPGREPYDATAPGEDAAGGDRDDARLEEMLDTARASLGLGALTRDRQLDAVAHEHALRLAATGELAHDAGDGDPVARLHEAGLDPPHSGENVAHASNVALAHRALWLSPSHRANMLARDFSRVGVAVVHDDHGDAWAVELFTGPSGPPFARP